MAPVESERVAVRRRAAVASGGGEAEQGIGLVVRGARPRGCVGDCSVGSDRGGNVCVCVWRRNCGIVLSVFHAHIFLSSWSLKSKSNAQNL